MTITLSDEIEYMWNSEKQDIVIERYSEEMEIPPSQPATADDQRNLEICTGLALSKALTNGFETRKFVSHRKVDFQQKVVTTALANKFKVYLHIFRCDSISRFCSVRH